MKGPRFNPMEVINILTKDRGYKVQLNPKHKIDSYYQDPVKDEIVTVFLSWKVSPFVKPKGIGLKI